MKLGGGGLYLEQFGESGGQGGVKKAHVSLRHPC